LNVLSCAGAICSESGVTWWTVSGVEGGCMAVDESSGENPKRLGPKTEVPKANWASDGWRGGMDGGPLERTVE
jgi:hypothetical protein